MSDDGLSSGSPKSPTAQRTYWAKYCAEAVSLRAEYAELTAPTQNKDEYFLMLREDDIRMYRAMLMAHYESCDTCRAVELFDGLRYLGGRLQNWQTARLRAISKGGSIFARLRLMVGAK